MRNITLYSVHTSYNSLDPQIQRAQNNYLPTVKDGLGSPKDCNNQTFLPVQESMEILALKDLLDLLDWLAKLEILDCQDRGVLMVKTELLEEKESLVTLDGVDFLANLEIKEKLESQVS